MQYIFKNLASGLQRFQKGSVVHGIQDSFRLLLGHQNCQKIVNQKEIRIVGLRRTGNHAIIQWIVKQQIGNVLCLNNLPIDESPYRHRYEYPEKNDLPEQIEKLEAEAKGEFTLKECLIYSYEDHPLKSVFSDRFEDRHDLYLGKSRCRYDVLLLRDPFNLFASRFKSHKIGVKETEQDMVSVWIEYAKEFLGETNYLKHQKICINYNEWFRDREYRRKIADLLDSEFSDAGIDEVSHYGGGSSFNQQNLQGKARQMDVLNRWKSFADDPAYRQLFKNPELFEYSEKIFGCLPGTDCLRSA
ncbi:MAG: hypothetical protein WBD58_10410 [Geitlerinemataceae cyanobacterium]